MPAYVERFETHGNVVFLAGSEAWKIKRAVLFNTAVLSGNFGLEPRS
jgi:aminoglycoside phosphotransferase family enzyme